MSPTQRTLKYLRGKGYTVEITEHWNFYGRVRKDLYGFVDAMALRDGLTGALGVQTTTQSNMSARVKKILTECQENAVLWLRTGNRIVVHGWAKKGKKGKRKLWELKKRLITLEDF